MVGLGVDGARCMGACYWVVDSLTACYARRARGTTQSRMYFFQIEDTHFVVCDGLTSHKRHSHDYSANRIPPLTHWRVRGCAIQYTHAPVLCSARSRASLTPPQCAHSLTSYMPRALARNMRYLEHDLGAHTHPRMTHDTQNGLSRYPTIQIGSCSTPLDARYYSLALECLLG